MRRKGWFAALTLAAVLVLAGCGSSAQNTDAANETNTADGTETTGGADAADAVKPLPAAGQASDEMPDGTYHVSFDGGADLTEEDGSLYLHMEFYEYDRYAVQDIEALEEGGQIEHNGEVYTVQSLERRTGSDGALTGVEINGGCEEYGISLLYSEDEDAFRSILMDDAYDTYTIGSGTIRLSEGIALKDDTVLDSPADELPEDQIGGYDDVREWMAGRSFGQNNTYAEIRDNEVASIEVKWVP
ncbi:MAG: hypothetical protein Q4C82_01075 [Eubacteriales bacterium]|nr:hypothetical protein [Eubacteriales bacterium]